MATDYGTDVSALPDLDPSFAPRTGRAMVGEAVARRYSTPRGSLPSDSDYGLDLREFVHEQLTTATATRLKASIEAEAEKDERVLSASAVTTFVESTNTLTVEITLQLADGPFKLVLTVTAVSVEVLRA